ncbi:uncharacterized protein LOC111363608 [Spodoptera litura]|uniref:Uncharacterized protein LOC111363608 n=1 Tax=Spodoptera litura TaxID=69820 RepID=A0A9J7EVI3_SPOLT|nr:uncharacterized protein LOC111363608 [Spodoptera litura]
MNIDTERLITEVRLRPVIWDLSHVFYKDRDARISAWQEVCKELIPDFDDKSESEKKDIDKQVQQRWKTARDAYVRCKATLKNIPSGSGGKKRKTYVYFEFMKFLDNKRELNTEDSILPNEKPNQNETAEYQNEGAVVSQPTGNEGTLEPQHSTSDDSNINQNSKTASNGGRFAVSVALNAFLEPTVSADGLDVRSALTVWTYGQH